MKRDLFLKREEILFYISWILFLLTTLFELTALSKDSSTIVLKGVQLLRYGAYGISILSIYYKIVEKSKVYAAVVMVGVFAISAFASTNKTMFLYTILFLAAYGLKSKHVIKVSCAVMSAFLFFMVFASQVGIIEDYIFEPEYRARHALGFAWTTTAPILLFFIVLQYVYLRKKQITYIELLILEVCNYVLYKLTDTRMAFYLLSLFIVTIAFAKLIRYRIGLIVKLRWLFVCVPSIACILSILIHACYNPANGIWVRLNDLLSGRLELGKNAIADFGYTLFGQKIEWVGFSIESTGAEKYNYVDCSYLRLLLEYGWFFLIVVVVIYSIIMYKAIKQEDYFLVWSIAFVLVISITEPRLMHLAFNPFPVILLSSIEREDTNYGSSKIAQT